MNVSADSVVQAINAPADRVLDITGETCPMTFVRTRLALDALQPGQRLLVRLRGPEPRRQVPESAQALGHLVLSIEDQADGSTQLLLQHGRPPARSAS